LCIFKGKLAIFNLFYAILHNAKGDLDRLFHCIASLLHELLFHERQDEQLDAEKNDYEAEHRNCHDLQPDRPVPVTLDCHGGYSLSGIL